MFRWGTSGSILMQKRKRIPSELRIGHAETKQQYLSQKIMFFLPQRTLIFIFLKDLLTMEIVSLSMRIKRRMTHTHTHTHTHTQTIYNTGEKDYERDEEKKCTKFSRFQE